MIRGFQRTHMALRASAPQASSKYTMYRDLKPVPKTRVRRVVGRFTTDVENFHGRIAMLGITGCALDETISKLPILQQFTTETGIPSIQLVALITVITSAFILETFNPITITTEEPELDVFTKPGFTLETEILHGRMAMLAFAYALLSEQLYNALVL
jgi:hypothetical protein